MYLVHDKIFATFHIKQYWLLRDPLYGSHEPYMVHGHAERCSSSILIVVVVVVVAAASGDITAVTSTEGRSNRLGIFHG
jgi:hypothetical protein